MSDLTYIKQSELVQYSSNPAETSNRWLTGYNDLTNANFRGKISEIAKDIIGTVSGALRAIGTNVVGAIMTTDGTQTATNKTLDTPNLLTPKIGGASLTVTAENLNQCSGLTSPVLTTLDSHSSTINSLADAIDAMADGGTFESPKINSLISTTITSEELNTIDGLMTQIGYLTGASSNIQVQLNTKTSTAYVDAAIADAIQRYDYAAEITTEAILTSYTLTASDILTSLGLTGNIDHRSLIISIWERNTGTSVMDLLTNDKIKAKWQSVGSPAVAVLLNINFTVEAETDYLICVNFKKATTGGGA